MTTTQILSASGGGYPPGPPGGWGPPGGAPPGGYGPPGGAPPGGWGPPGGAPPGGWGPPGGAPPGGHSGGFGAPPPGYGSPPPGGPKPFGFSPAEALTFGFNALQKDFGGVGLGVGLAYLVAIVPVWLIALVTSFISGVLQSQFEGVLVGILTGSMHLLVSLAGVALGAYALAGVTVGVLRTVRGQRVRPTDFLTGGRYFVRFLVATVVAAIPVSIGSSLCLIPGLLVLGGLCLTGPLIVEEKLGPIEALQRSWAMTSGHRVNLLVFFLIAALLELVGAGCFFFGLVFVAMPVVCVGVAYIYLTLKGETPRLPA